MRRKAPRLTRPMIVHRYSGSSILAPTSDNFPALKHFWDMNHVSGAVIRDTVGDQHITSSAGAWVLDSEGFAKYKIDGTNWAPTSFEAPGDRDFMLVGCGRISWNIRAFSIGGMIDGGPDPAPGTGISFDVSLAPVSAAPNAYFDADNRSETAPWSFSDDFSETWVTDPETYNCYPDPANPGIKGCFATVISPSAGTCMGYWAGRIGETAAYDPIYEAHNHTIFGDIQQTWGAVGNGWTMFPGNRIEWVALMYFDTGAPLDMEEAVRWMAQYNDFRLYPGWVRK